MRHASKDAFPAELVRAGMVRTPLRCTDKDSWHGHIPFAFWCIEALEPRVFVELGSHKGDSYCAFCQAVVESGAQTRCYAVDTWAGDSQAGFYGDEVFEELRFHHDRRYHGFSELVRATFDEAAERFDAASIDLLHIDGAHGYEDVRHDFESWRSKLSERGAVLLHDTEVRDGGFGVRRLWAELQREYPSFSFTHSHGLGVLAVGDRPPEPLRRLTGLDDAAAEDTRRLFARLGDAVLLKGARQGLARQRVRLAELEASFNELGASFNELEASFKATDHRVAVLEAERNAVYRSVSWRVTTPVRAVGRLLRRLRGRAPGEGERSTTPPSEAESEPEPEPAVAHAAPTPSHSPALAALLADTEWTLAMPRAESPDVSIVVVTFNRAQHSYECFRSLVSHDDVPFELIVVDNASADETGELLSRMRNVAVIRNQENLGFGRACNQAAARAAGEHLLFLNNDASVMPGCLSALLETVRQDAGCGVVGGRLVWPDGRLQEAGSIVWADGTAEAYGRGSDPDAPEFGYVRDVDFCSGALLLVRHSLFEALGGFDERYAPAYYEDADLAMGVRRRGCRVLYQPRAVARHHEHGSSGHGAATTLMRRNHERFAEKWRAELDRQYVRSPANRLRARERVARPRVLVVDDRVPTSDVGSGYPRAYELLRLLRHHEYPVTLFPAFDPTPHEPWLSDLQARGVEAICDGRPFSRFAEERDGLYDAVLVSRPHNLGTVRSHLARRFPRAVVVYDAEALFFARDEPGPEGLGGGDPAEAARRQQQELDLLRSAHVVVAVSERERQLLTRMVPDLEGQIEVWSHPVQLRPTPRPFGERSGLLFLGSFFAPRSPNRAALSHLVDEVLPLVRPRIACPLQVVGFAAEKVVGDLGSDGVKVVGYVPDPTPFYDRCRVFVVPHLRSAGIPLKLCEAMGRGLPAVVSELTALQLDVENEREVLVGRTPGEMADQIVRLHSDQGLWHELRENALEFIRRRHDPESLGQALDEILSSALAARPASGG